METMIDKFGRIVIPKKIRDSLGLKPGSSFYIEENNREIRLKPVEGTPQLKNKNGWLVFTGEIQGEVNEFKDSHLSVDDPYSNSDSPFT